MEEIVGVVEAVSVKGNNRYSIKIGSNWFHGFGKAPSKGEKVYIQYVVSQEGWKNIRKIVRESEVKKFLEPENGKQEQKQETQEQSREAQIQPEPFKEAAQISFQEQMALRLSNEQRRAQALRIAVQLVTELLTAEDRKNITKVIEKTLQIASEFDAFIRG